MISLNILISAMILAGIAAFIISKINRTAGGVLTILTSVGVLAVFLLGGKYLEAGSFGIISFQPSPAGWFFSIVILVVYSGAAFFNPYWMGRMKNHAAYNMLFILSMTGLTGVFSASNLITLFVFWEIAAWSSVLVISLGRSKNAYTAYFAMSSLGSFAMLYCIFMLYSRYHTFDIELVLASLAGDPEIAVVSFLMMILGAIVKLGVFPFHVAMPGALGHAPHSFSPVLSGGLEKMGAYLAILMMTLFPVYSVLEGGPTVFGVPLLIYILMVMSAIGIIVGTLMAVKQDDMKMLFAYSSVANGGYIFLAVLLNSRMALSGALIHVMAHALSSASAFLAIAAVEYRTGTTRMSQLGGLAHRMPVTFSVYIISILTMVGIPPTMGFLPKWLLFQTLAGKGLFILAGAAFFGSIGSFLYVYKPLSTVFLGQLSRKYEDMKEVPAYMCAPMVVLSAVSVYYGMFSKSLVEYTGQIERSLGFERVIETAGYSINGSNGSMNSLLITLVFLTGFLISGIIFLAGKRSRKVDLMDTYTAGEFIHTPGLYHYGHGYSMSFERLYEKHPNVARVYENLVDRVNDAGKLVKELIYNRLVSHGVLLAVIVMIFIMWGDNL